MGAVAPALAPTALWTAALYDGAIASCAVVCLLGARRLSTPARLPWKLVAAGCACFFAGDVVWDFYEHVRHVAAPLPSGADAAYLAAYPLFLAAAFLLLRRRTSVDTVAGLLDAGVVALALGLVLFEPLLLGTANGVAAPLVAGAYPVFDIALLGLAVLLAWGDVPRSGKLLVVAAFTTLSLADLSYLVLVRDGNYSTGGWPDPLFVLAPLLLAAAAWYETDVDAPAQRDSPRIVAPVAVGVAAFVALPVDFGLAASGGHRRHELAVRVGLRLVLLAGVGARLVYQAAVARRALRAAREVSDRIKLVLAHTADAVIFTTPDGIVREWNKAAEGLFKLSRERALGTEPVRRFSEESQQRMIEAVRANDTRGTEMTVPIEVDGRTIPLALHVEAVRSETGDLAGFVTVARDDTRGLISRHVRRTFSGLDPDAAMREFAESIHEYVPFDVLSLSTVEGDGDTFRELARVSRDRTGAFRVVERDGLLGGSLRAIGYVETGDPYVLINADNIGQFAEPVRALATTGLIALPLRHGDGSLRGFLSLAFDDARRATQSSAEALARVTIDMAQAVENMVLFEEQQLFADELLELNEMRDSFLALLAHEVRGPLRAIVSAATVLRDRRHSMSPEQTQNMLDGIVSSATNVTRITGDLIDAGRTGEGRFPCVGAHIPDLGVLVKAAASAACGDDAHRVAVTVDAGVALRGDADRITQVVGNLVSNACKFTDGDIEVHLTDTGAAALVRVVDHGPGIPAAQSERVFERYARLHGDGIPRRPGTGLGLYIARELVRAHGGDLTYEDTPGGGATFVAVFPRAADAAQS